MKKVAFGSIVVLGLIGPLNGCTSMNKTQQGAISGGAGGALLGLGIGALSGGSGTIGALIGAGVGTVAGGIYGYVEDNM